MAGPVVRNAHVEARITVKKTGDPFTRSKVRVYTLDGSAKAGKGYQAMTQVTRQKYFPYVNHLLNGYLCNMDTYCRDNGFDVPEFADAQRFRAMI